MTGLEEWMDELTLDQERILISRAMRAVGISFEWYDETLVILDPEVEPEALHERDDFIYAYMEEVKLMFVKETLTNLHRKGVLEATVDPQTGALRYRLRQDSDI